jgi:hypothetical protein
MLVFRGTDSLPFGPVRVHPYEKSTYDDNVQYYDFRVHPQLIREKLEDFKPWEQYEVIQNFYGLLEWISSDASVFDSNDCAFQGPSPNVFTKVSNRKLQCDGRLMIFYRALGANLDTGTLNSLLQYTGRYLGEIDPEFADGRVDLSFFDTAFEAIGNQIGKELVIQFVAFGDSEEETFENLTRVFANVRYALEKVNEHVLEAMNRQS